MIISKNKDQIFDNFNFTLYIYYFFILRFLGKKPIVYLRSDGYGEYKAILGNLDQYLSFYV